MPHLLRLPVLSLLSPWHFLPSAMDMQLGITSCLVPLLTLPSEQNLWSRTFPAQGSFAFASAGLRPRGPVALGMEVPEGSLANKNSFYECLSARHTEFHTWILSVSNK